MRSASFARLFAFVLQIALLSGAARAAGADLSDAEKDSEFFVTACQNSINDPATVGRLANEQNWNSLVDPDRVDFKPLKIRGMWRVTRDGRTYTVTSGVDPKGITSCFVSFGEPAPNAMISPQVLPRPYRSRARMMARARAIGRVCSLRLIGSRIFQARCCKSSRWMALSWAP